MNKAIQIDTCYIGSHFASPLVNGDTSGLEANEDYQLEDWYGGLSDPTRGRLPPALRRQGVRLLVQVRGDRTAVGLLPS